jgi:hypothetical protein
MVPIRAVAIPAAAWALFCMVWLLLAALGVPAGVDGRSMNLTEAAAVASHADAARLLGAGADPNARARLRAGLVKNAEMMMTPLEAATGAIRTGPVQMLVDHGATIDQANYAVLWCGAKARSNQEMLEFLRRYRSGEASLDCAKLRSIW